MIGIYSHLDITMKAVFLLTVTDIQVYTDLNTCRNTTIGWSYDAAFSVNSNWRRSPRIS